jgi:hypothetical protein
LIIMAAWAPNAAATTICHRHRPGRMEREGLVAHLPAVTVRAVQHAAPPQRAEPVDLGEDVADADREEHSPSANLDAVGEADCEMVLLSTHRRHANLSQLDGIVRGELLARDAQQLGRFRSVACEEAVRRGRRRVAWRPVVDDERAAARAAEDERGAEACGASADDYDVDHRVRSTRGYCSARAN